MLTENGQQNVDHLDFKYLDFKASLFFLHKDTLTDSKRTFDGMFGLHIWLACGNITSSTVY